MLTSPDSFAELAEAWKELIREAPTATPFQTFEWQSTWWRHYGKGKRLRILACFDGNDLVGLYPLSVTAVPWRVLRAIGNLSSDYLHPLARKGYESEVAQAIADYLRIVPAVDLIDLHQVREDQPLASAGIGQAACEQARCLVLDLPPTYDAYLGTLGKSLRYDVRKLDRDLFSSGRAKVEAAGADNLEQGLTWFFAAHRKRWRRRGMPGAFLGKSEAFHRDWAAQAEKMGTLWLSALTVDGEPVGAIYAMALGSTCYFYQAGFDPSKGALSPGSLLVAHTIRRAIEEGKTSFDFLRGDEAYKRRWKPQRVLTNYRLLGAVTPVAGKLGMRWNGVGNLVEGRLRARLEGRGLL